MARRLDAGLVGALLWWAGDIAVLWACFEALGSRLACSEPLYQSLVDSQPLPAMSWSL
jgi:hypothetical protein